MAKLIFEFTGEQAEEFAKDFQSWMCNGGGEQDYWNHLEFNDKLPDSCNFIYDWENLKITVKLVGDE